MRRWALIAAIPMLLATGCSNDSPEEDPKKYLSGTVQIGANSDLPGWSDYTNGVWSGFDVSLGNWLGEELDFRPQYVPLTTDERMTKLREASTPDAAGAQPIKIVISNFSITDERHKYIDFAGPYYTTKQGIMTLSTSSVKSLKDIENQQVCASLGSTTIQRIGEINVLGVPERTLKRCVDKLYAKEVVAISSDIAILDGFAKQNPNLHVVPAVEIGYESYGIGIPNNRPKLCEFLNKKLAQFISRAWDQKAKDTLSGVPTTDRKPNEQALDPCEQPGPVAQGAQQPGPGPAVALSTASRATRARRRRRLLS